jgi:hypothetical protein
MQPSARNNLLQHPAFRIALFSIILLITVIGLWRWALGSGLGIGDFGAYWSATYLVANDQNPYSDQAMLEVEQQHTGWPRDYAVMAWNPPTLFVFLLPLVLLPFQSAAAAWLTINTLMVLLSVVLLSRMYFPDRSLALLLFALFAFTFTQLLTAIIMGQITFLILFGLTVSLWLVKQERWFWAGAVLILTSVKPQMSVLAVLYILLLMARQRHWTGWLGLLVAGLACVVILFVLRPIWVQDLIGLSRIAPVSWATPTIGGLLSYLGITDAARYLIVLLLPLPFVLAWSSSIKPETAVALLVVLTVPTTFFGWPYDQSVLLIPTAEIFGWLVASSNQKKIVFGGVLILLTVMSLAHHRVGGPAVGLVWVPVVWAVVYAAAWMMVRPGDDPLLTHETAS